MDGIQKIAPYLPEEIFACLKSCRDRITEIRIRRGKPLAVTLAKGESGGFGFGENYAFSLVINDSLMNRVIDSLCHHSLYSHMETMVEGYIAMKEGFRVGVVGKAVCEEGRIKNLASISGLNIRIPAFFPNVACELYTRLEMSGFTKSLLLFSPPNMGKTTILRDLILLLSSGTPSRRVAVVDTRCEIETEYLRSASHVDFLSGYPRGKGIEIATRTLSPQYIICDEIGGFEEAESLLSAQNCGVPVVASAHAATLYELLSRKNIRILHDFGLFSEYVGIRKMRVGKPPLFSFTSLSEIKGSFQLRPEKSV